MALLTPYFRRLYANSSNSEIVEQINAIQEFVEQLPLRAGANVRILTGTDGQIIDVDIPTPVIEEAEPPEPTETGTRLQ